MSVTLPRPEDRDSLTSAGTAFSRERRLSHPERMRLAAEIVVAYARVRRGLRRAPVDAVVAALRASSTPGRAPASAPTANRLDETRRLSRAVTRTLVLLPGDTRCLMQALVLTGLLARRGIPAKLVIGARTTPRFFAHAWVELAGQPVLATGGGLFTTLVEL
jgi:hypothetical protein